MNGRILNKVTRGRGNNYLASVSDLMSGLLFIFILTLALAIIDAREAKEKAVKKEAEAAALTLKNEKAEKELQRESEKVKKQEEELKKNKRELQESAEMISFYQEKLSGINKARNALLLNIAQKLQNEYNIAVAVDATGGILRLPEESVTFESGSELLNDKNRDKVKKFGKVLEQELPCFGVGNETNADCREINPQGYTLDAVFIEGHTDNMPFKNEPGNSGAGNRKLSTSRSNTVYDIMINGSPILKSMVNPKDERLFSISGYGEERPLPGHAHKSQTDDAANRRIEMRFILTSPDLNESERAMLDSLKRGASDL